MVSVSTCHCVLLIVRETDAQFRECWCGDALAGISEKLDDEQCNYPCEGNKTQACGGALKLTLYHISSAPAGVSVSAGLLAVTGLAIAWLS